MPLRWAHSAAIRFSGAFCCDELAAAYCAEPRTNCPVSWHKLGEFTVTVTMVAAVAALPATSVAVAVIGVSPSAYSYAGLLFVTSAQLLDASPDSASVAEHVTATWSATV